MLHFASISKLRQKGIIGMNYRNVELIGRYNDRRKYPLVDNKIITKKIALEAGITVTELYATIEWQSQLKQIETILAPYENFVIKPAHGSGGKGIIVITHREGNTFFKSSGKAIGLGEIKSHISNTLSGLYSLGGRYDVAIIEKLVIFDPIFQNYSYEGVPDIRVIIYRGYPIMAMMRCPTQKSDGKANLHQGAIGVGIDLSTGKAINAVQHNQPIQIHPDTKHHFLDLHIPRWEEILHLAAKCYEITGLGYLGVDLVFDKHLGPLLLELNARPGLAIQIANNNGTLHRVNRVDQEKIQKSVDERVRFSMEVLSFI